MAISLAVWIAGAIAIGAATGSGPIAGLLVMVVGFLVPLGLVQAARTLRGTVAHTVIAPPPLGWSEAAVRRWRAAAPSLCGAAAGLGFAFVVLVATGDTDGLAAALETAGALLFGLGLLAALATGAVLRPRFLIPATMRPGREP